VYGLARLGEDGVPGQAALLARAAGSWSDDVAVSARLLSSRLVLAGEPQWDAATSTVECGFGEPAPLVAGDLVRVTYPGTRVQLLFAAVAPPLATAGTATVWRGAAALWLAPWLPDSATPVPATVYLEDNAGATITVDAKVSVTKDGAMAGVELYDAPELVPAAGTLLRLDVPDSQLLLPVIRVYRTELIGRPMLVSHTPPQPTSPPAGPGVAEVLTFELRTRVAQDRLFVLGPLGFHRDHPRYAGALPTDEELYGSVPTPDDPAVPPRPALWQEASSPRFPVAGIPGAPMLYPIGMDAGGGAVPPPPEATDGAQSQARWVAAPTDPGTGRRLERDGLGVFGTGIFLDPALAGAGTNTTLETADFVRYRSENARDLVGIHALLGIDEVTLVAVPDAVHRGWLPAEPAGVPSPPAREAFVTPAECGHAAAATPTWGFQDCAAPSLPTPSWDSAQADRHGNVHLVWNAVPQAAEYLVEESTDDRSWRAVREVYQGPGTALDVVPSTSGNPGDRQLLWMELYGLPPGSYFYRLRALAGEVSSDWSDGIAVAVTAGEPWTASPTSDSTLLAVHRSLVRMCAARGDMLAVLSVPRHYRERDVIAHTARLRGGAQPTSTDGSAVLPLAGEERALSFGAVYHPWPVTAADRTSRAVPVPPDGAATGVLARRALLRGAWIAPANETLTDVVALEPALASPSYQPLQDGRVNTVRHEPRGFLWLSADTLSDDPDLRPVNVRRLMSLLRRVVLRDGPTYVFEPNDGALVRQLQRRFEALLGELLVRGAFAATTADEAYQVVVGSPPNTAQSLNRGQLIVELKVAPSIPMRYLTVQLVQTGGRVVTTEGT
jgi:hypothetical protein